MKDKIVMLQKVNNEGINLLYNDPKRFWEGITNVGDAAFFGKKSLQYVNVPSKVKEIGKHAFSKSGIEDIKLNRGLSIIKESAFDSCDKLESVKLPSTVVRLEKKVFNNCKNLEKVILSKKISEISDESFYECKNLKSIIIPNKVLEVGNGAFSSSGLENIKLGKDLLSIGSYAFSHCSKLKKIKLSPNVEKIERGAFYGAGIKEIVLNNKLNSIGDSAFSHCENIEIVELPNSVLHLGKETFKESSIKKVFIGNRVSAIPIGCFYNCKNLESIELPDSVGLIKAYSFSGSGLKSIKINRSVSKIDNYAFENCKNLEKVYLPCTLSIIGAYCFSNDINLKDVHLEKGIKKIEKNAFLNCKSIEQIELPKSINVIEEDAFKGCNFKYIYKLNNENWILSKDILNRNDIKKVYDISEIGEVYSLVLPLDNYNEMYNKLKMLRKNNISVTNECFENHNFNAYILYTDNFDFMKRLSKKLKLLDDNKKYALSFYKFMNNLGAFYIDKIARQKACNFIENLFDKNLITFDDIDSFTKKMNFDNYKEEWAEFIMKDDNLLELIKIENEDKEELIANTYNRFLELKEYCRSNKGNQRYLKVTLERTIKCFGENPFEGVDETNRDIAVELAKFTNKQETFNEAASIRAEFLILKNDKKVKDNILKEDLKETFDEIGNLKSNITNDTKEVIKNLNDVSDKKFTYEFLSKYDPKNFVLGKYCSCCSHLEGIGRGIVYASVLNPNCQNLVIKNSKGRIIAKSILYINREQGYGVFNNFEVDENIIDEEIKNVIYKKFKKGISDFVTKYNEINEIKITQINVGMDFNDLKTQIRKDDTSSEILQAIDFSDYTYPYSSHPGDWQDEQYVIWKK